MNRQENLHAPLVSVVIATRNEEKNIERILLDLKQQSYPNLEIMVVDHGSVDATREIAARFTTCYHLPDRIRLDGVKNYRGAQINFGASVAKGEYLFFPDCDMTFDPALIAEAVALMQSGDDALYIPEIIVGNGFFGKVRNFERSFYNATCIDAPRFVRKAVFMNIGGFDEKNIAFAPDDWDLAKQLKKAGARFGLTQHCKYHHEEWLTLSIYLKKKGAYMATFDDYIAKWGRDDPDVRRQFGVWYRFFGVFMENGKWKRLIFAPHLTISLYFLRFAVGVRFLLSR